MMSDELAKRLKDAGFSLRVHDYVYEGHDEYEGEEACKRCGSGNFGDYCYPTLSELIEVCGEKFGGLIRGGRKYWRAFLDGATGMADPNLADDAEWPVGDGETPEEAVARLWLALHVTGDATA